jgi:hypothetical protein
MAAHPLAHPNLQLTLMHAPQFADERAILHPL